MEDDIRIRSAFWALRATLGATALLSGADKFTNLLTDWGKYLPRDINKQLPVSKKTFMRTVGVVEMLVGIGILSPRIKLSSYAASGWLLAIVANLFMSGDYDVAVRDANMAVAAFALGQLSAAREREQEEEKLVEGRLHVA